MGKIHHIESMHHTWFYSEATLTGILYIVATPIGNLTDLSARAIDTLKTVAYIAAEDTRHSKILLNHFAIRTPLVSYHEHNETRASEKLIQDLKNGLSIALITDAGTPLISDPGYTLVTKAHEEHIRVSPIPGASAAIAALSVAGIPSERFAFEGFLPAKKMQRIACLQALVHETRTLIFYETPHRILDALHDLCDCLGETRQATIAREITKLFETIKHDNLLGLKTWLEKNPEQQKGEFVLIIAGASETKEKDAVLAEKLLAQLTPHLPLSQAVKIVVEVTGVKRNKLYAKGLK